MYIKPSLDFSKCRHRLGTLNSALMSFLRRGKVTQEAMSMSAVIEMDEDVSVIEHSISIFKGTEND